MSQIPDPYSRPDKASPREYVPFHALQDSHFGSEDHIQFLRNHYERQARFLDLALTKANFYLAQLDPDLDALEIRIRHSNIQRLENLLPFIERIRAELD